MVGIIGSGFGLYGYLPSVLQSNGKAALLSRSMTAFQLRPELQPFKNDIHWYENEHQLIDACSELIISVPPASQAESLTRILNATVKPRNLIIEKPVAPNPKASCNLLQRLDSSGINYRIGYTFLYTEWIKPLLNAIEVNRSRKLKCNIEWTFEAHHFKHAVLNWKRFNSAGGGVLRFYGIHVIALLSRLGFDKPLKSRTYQNNNDEPYRWTLEATDSLGCTTTVNVNSNTSTPMFSVAVCERETNETYFEFNANDPFYSNSNTSLDKRIPTLNNLYHDLKTDSVPPKILYNQINKFWAEIESVNEEG